MANRLKRVAVALTATLALSVLGLASPADAGSGSRSVQGCNWSGSNGYAGYPYWVGYGKTTSNCSHVEVRVRAVINGSWTTRTKHGYNGTVTLSLGSMDALTYSDHNVHIGSVAYGFRVYL